MVYTVILNSKVVRSLMPCKHKHALYSFIIRYLRCFVDIFKALVEQGGCLVDK